MLRSFRAFGTYALLTVALTWPLAANLTIMDAGDSAFFAWEIGWELHALKTDPARLPHGNVFHPLRYTLGMDEPVLGTTLPTGEAFDPHQHEAGHERLGNLGVAVSGMIAAGGSGGRRNDRG